jgi:hypothetical protein
MELPKSELYVFPHDHPDAHKLAINIMYDRPPAGKPICRMPSYLKNGGTLEKAAAFFQRFINQLGGDFGHAGRLARRG